MGLLNYMNGGPYFLATNRQSARGPISVPAKAVQSSKAAYDDPYADIDIDANPGEKQWLTDEQNIFNNTVQSLLPQYDYDMSWVKTDPKYKSAVSRMRNYVMNLETGSKNKKKTTLYDASLASPDNANNPTDTHMDFVNGQYVVSVLTENSVPVNKQDYLDATIEGVNFSPRGDGTLDVVRLDDNAMDSRKFYDNLDGFYGARGAANSSAWDEKIRDEYGGRNPFGIEMVGTIQERKGGSVASNYEQVAAMTRFFMDHGFDNRLKYFVAQQVVNDYVNGKPIQVPKTNEDGSFVYVKDKKGNNTEELVLEDYDIKPEDLQDPSKMAYLSQLKTTDLIFDYKDKWLSRQTTSVYEREEGPQKNLDEYGRVIEDLSDYWVDFPKGKTDAMTGKESVMIWQPGKDQGMIGAASGGKWVKKPVQYEATNQNYAGEGDWDNARKSVEGASISEKTDINTSIRIGDKWYTDKDFGWREILADAKIMNLNEVRTEMMGDGTEGGTINVEVPVTFERMRRLQKQLGIKEEDWIIEDPSWYFPGGRGEVNNMSPLLNDVYYEGPKDRQYPLSQQSSIGTTKDDKKYVKLKISIDHQKPAKYTSGKGVGQTEATSARQQQLGGERFYEWAEGVMPKINYEQNVLED